METNFTESNESKGNQTEREGMKEIDPDDLFVYTTERCQELESVFDYHHCVLLM